MRNKIVIAAACMQLFGCANLKYPGWQNVKIANSAYQQPCKKVGVDECSAGGCENNHDWFRKRATKYDGNNVIYNFDKESGNLKSASYYYCAPGLPPYQDELPPLYMVVNKFNPAATQLDYEKADAECEYDAHRSTLDAGAPVLVRQQQMLSLEDSILEARAIEADRLNKLHHADVMQREKGQLYNKCMASKGFISTLSTEKKDLIEADKYCPDKTSFVRYCYIPKTDK